MLRAEQLHREKEAAFNRLLAEMEKNLAPGENSDPDHKYLRRYSEIVSQSAQKFTALKLPCAETMPNDAAYAEWFRRYEEKEARLGKTSLGRLTKFMKLDIAR